MSLRGAKRRSNLMVIDEIATLPTVARNDKRGLRHSLDSSANGSKAYALLLQEIDVVAERQLC